MDPVKGITFPAGPTINPTKTYDAAIEEGMQYDGLLIPAGLLQQSRERHTADQSHALTQVRYLTQ